MSREQADALRTMLRQRPVGLPVAARRAGFEALAAAPPLPDDFRDHVVDAGGVPARWVWVDGTPADRAVLWLHGGAFTVGSSNSYREFAVRLSRASGARVLVVDYRLVPEHRFPAALEDSVAALAWLLATLSPTQVAIGGDSAGGNLAVAALQHHLAADLPLPAAVWLLSPYLDLTHSGASIVARAARDPFVNPAAMVQVAADYRGDATAADPRVSPLSGQVAGFPPTLIQVGSDEALFDDSRRFADRLHAAGCDVVFQEWVGMVHVWPFFAARLDEGQWALAQAGSFVAERLDTGPSPVGARAVRALN